MNGDAPASILESARAAFERGESLWLVGEIDAAIGRREEAYAEFRRAGDVARAAEIALWLVIEQATSLGNQTAAGGWFKRAQRLLAGAPLCPAHAQLEVHRGQLSSDPAAAERHFERAVEIGKELGDPESEIRGLGFLRVSLGDVEGGMALLDESMAAAMAGNSKTRGRSARRAARCCSPASESPICAGLRSGAEWLPTSRSAAAMCRMSPPRRPLTT